MIVSPSADFDIQKIADSGQCFRLNACGTGDYRLIAGTHVLRISGQGALALKCAGRDCGACTFCTDFFDLKTDYGAFIDRVPARDAYLRAATAYGRGIRILRQDPWEMLITFIISQRKNIPAIKRAVECLSTQFGRALEGGLFAFPTPEALAAQTEEQLAPAALGYRTKYVLAAARMVAGGQLDLCALESAPDAALCEALKAVPGVGEKVAKCVMLFGFHRLRAFPKDVWINRTLQAQYEGEFPPGCEGFEGVMQQYLFYYARASAPRKKAGATALRGE